MLQFGWQGKKSHCFQNSLLKIPDKLTPRCYSPGGSISPNFPKNPPTTPVSEFESRGSSPNPMPSRLNANAPPFIPGTAADDPGSGAENCDGGECGEHDISTGEITTGEVCPNIQTSFVADSTPLGSELQAEGNSTPVQTIGVPTPPMEEAEATESGALSREVQQAVPGMGSTAEAEQTPQTNSPHSPCTHHQPPQTHTSPSHPLPSPSTVSPEPTGRQDPMNDTLTSSHEAHNPPGTHHTDTSTTAHKPKTWASIVRQNGSGSSQVTTPTTCTAVHNVEENKVERREVVKEGGGGGEGGRKGGREEEEGGEGEMKEEVTNSTQPLPSAHLRSLGGKRCAVMSVSDSRDHSLSTDQLKQIHVSHTSVCLQPRGLINQGNWCYMHAVSPP